MLCPNVSAQMPRQTSKRRILFCTEVDGQGTRKKAKKPTREPGAPHAEGGEEED